MTTTTGLPVSVARRFAAASASSRVTYKSANAAIATVDERGVVTAGTQPGQVLIHAFDTISDATAIASFTVVASAITSIDLSPSPAIVMQRGTQRVFTATAHFTDGTSRDVSREVLWSSTNEAAAVVGNTSLDKGVVSAVAGGDTTILATDATTLIQGRSIVFVSQETPHLVAVVVSPNPAMVGVGKTFQFGALGLLSDGSSTDLTRSATWSSSRTDIATVDNTGVVTGVAMGDTTITAVAPAPSTTVRGSAPAKVVP